MTTILFFLFVVFAGASLVAYVALVIELLRMLWSDK